MINPKPIHPFLQVSMPLIKPASGSQLLNSRSLCRVHMWGLRYRRGCGDGGNDELNDTPIFKFVWGYGLCIEQKFSPENQSLSDSGNLEDLLDSLFDVLYFQIAVDSDFVDVWVEGFDL